MLPHIRGTNAERQRFGRYAHIRRYRYDGQHPLHNGGLAWWGAIFIFLLLYLYTKQLMLDIEEDAEISAAVESDSIPFHLADMHPKGTVGENLARWSDHGSKTPLIISHTFGSALAYIQAATESHILPNEPNTMLHMSLNTLLLTPSATPASPPQAGNSSVGRPPWVEGSPPGSFLLAAAAGGFTNRIFQVSPAPENRDSIEYDSGEVHYQHRPRQEAVIASCSLHLNASNMLEISQGTDIACCHGCKVRPRAGGMGDVEVAAPGGRVEGGIAGGGGWNESVDQGGFLSGFGRAVEEGSGESGGYDAAARPVRFQSWRGELADASKPEEVDFDADELINAIMPMGSYVLSIGMSFFARSSERRRLAEECRWLTDKPVATRCVLPLSKTPPGTPVSVAYPIAVSNLITAALSTHSAPEELPRDCLSAYVAFRTYMWSATSRNRFASFVKHHPFEAAGELCTPSKWRSRTGHREETMQALWVKRRVETVRRFLLAIKRNLRPPSMILVATSDEPFELPMPRSRFVQEEVVHSLQNLRLSPSDVYVANELEGYAKQY